ncbi:MAG: serine/threonine protein kinase [Myxococcaceae bacterium]|nr:serine/threonine protein kinase [Myxococcaceae bacterium]
MSWLSNDVLAHVERVTEEPDLDGTRYTLRGLIGRGGMGSVWLAFDRELEREVAVKVTEGALSHEAKVMAQLEHPGIVPVHETGTLVDGRVYVVMKRVRGERLDVWAAKADLKARLRLFQRVCEAIAFAHARGVLHRDLKPQNVMVGELGEALVMDWGLARRASEPHEPGHVAGTPAFMAPEAARGEPATPATDVYGLGAMLKVLAGADVPAAVAAIGEKATAASPAARYESAGALSEDIGRFLERERVLAWREPLAERVARFASKNSVILGLFGVYLLLRLVLLLF